jgi:hypothetical protein
MAMYNSAHRINQPNADDTWRTQMRINAPTKRDEIVAEQWLEDSFDSTCARQKKELGKCASARQPRKLATKLVARTSTMTSTSPTSHKSNNTTKCEKSIVCIILIFVRKEKHYGIVRPKIVYIERH